MTRKFTRTLVAAALGAFAIGAAAAAAASQLPPIRKMGDTEYINGGAGTEEAHAVEKAGAQWPLMIVFAQQEGKQAQRGEFVAEANAVIHDAKGAQVLSLDKAGPILLANLEPGEYSIDATLGGKTLQRKVRIRKDAAAKIELLWPGGTVH